MSDPDDAHVPKGGEVAMSADEHTEYVVKLQAELDKLRGESDKLRGEVDRLAASSKQWSVFFDDMERDYRGGEKRALVLTIAMCSRFNLRLPAWAREAFLEAWLSLPKSWDDVFGRPLAKGKGHEAERRRHRIGTAVIGRVRELHSQGEPIDIALFEKVGKEFGVSAGTARRYYYDDEEIAEWFKLINDPDDFYKELYEQLERYRKEAYERLGIQAE